MKERSAFEYGIAICMLAISVFVFVDTAGFPEPRSGTIGVGTFPRVLASILVVLSVVRLGTRVASRYAKSDTDPERRVLDRGRSGALLALSILSCVVYIALLAVFGFVASSIAFLAALMTVYGERRTPVVVVFSVGFTLLLWVLFALLANVPLPRPIWA